MRLLVLGLSHKVESYVESCQRKAIVQAAELTRSAKSFSLLYYGVFPISVASEFDWVQQQSIWADVARASLVLDHLYEQGKLRRYKFDSQFGETSWSYCTPGFLLAYDLVLRQETPLPKYLVKEIIETWPNWYPAVSAYRKKIRQNKR